MSGLSKYAFAIISLCLNFTYAAIAQDRSGSIRGRVFSADGNPAYVTVELKASKKLTITNNSGYFIFSNLAALEDTLIVSSVDAKTFSRPINLLSGQRIDLGEIHLLFNIRQLQDVEVKGRIAHSYKSDYSFFGSKTETPVKDLPLSISTVTKELIRDKMELTLKDAVDQAVGVNQYSGFDEYTIRGFRAENARDVDGLRGYNTTYTSAMLVNIERVEIIKGPTASLYGNCDPGGTINLVTKKPLDIRENQADIYWGSWSHFRAQADVTGPFDKSKDFLYRFNGGYDNSGSFRDLQHSKSFQLAPAFTFIKNDKWEANYEVSVSHINTSLDWGQPGLKNSDDLKSTPISLSLTQPGDYLKETDIASILTLSHKFNDRLSLNAGYLYYNTHQSIGSHGFNGYIIPDSVNLYYTSWAYKTQTHTVSSYLTYRTRSKGVSHIVVLGYDFIKSSVNLDQQYYEDSTQFGSGSGIVGTFSLSHPHYGLKPASQYDISNFDSDLTNVDGNIYHTQGVYAQDLVSFKNWNLLLSIREEFYRGESDDSSGAIAENVFLPRLGIVYKPKQNISLYFSFNRGFDPFEESTSAQVFGNVPFKPQISNVIETGAKANLFDSKLTTSLAVYQLTVSNVAVNANDPANPNLFVQQGQDRSRGIEFETVGNILPNLSVYISYAYCIAEITKSKIDSEIGMIKDNAPKNESSTWIKYSVGRSKIGQFGLSLGHSQVSRRSTLDSRTKLPGYIILNGGLFYSFKKVGFAINIYNVFNRDYWIGAYNNVSKWPGAPRNLMANIHYQF